MTGGQKANDHGERAKSIVRNMLRLRGFEPRLARTLAELQATKSSLFSPPGQFAEGCLVPLRAPWHRRTDLSTKVDFVILLGSGHTVLLNIKSQHSDGSAEHKLEYVIQQLISTELPSALLVLGPIRGQDDDHGWSLDVLGPIWDRAMHYGGSRVFLFRTPERLTTWIQAGMPVGDRGVTSAEVFARFCDREP